MDLWNAPGTARADSLIDARLELHYAVQIAAAPGKQLLPERPDFSQQSFVWDAGAGVLAQGLVDAAVPFRSALRLSPPTLLLLGGDGGALAELALAGQTVEQARDWLAREIEGFGPTLAAPLESPEPPRCPGRPGGVPPHPLGQGTAFTDEPAEAFAEIERLFADADALLQEISRANPGASPVRCWPHHFDIATLIALDPEGDPETARSIGVGLSPGDCDRPLPYFYVTPWPYPEGRALPDLAAGGVWNTAGWTGAVLEYPALTAPERAREFLQTTVAECRRLLETTA